VASKSAHHGGQRSAVPVEVDGGRAVPLPSRTTGRLTVSVLSGAVATFGGRARAGRARWWMSRRASMSPRSSCRGTSPP
jgi:hypothetical protein